MADEVDYCLVHVNDMPQRVLPVASSMSTQQPGTCCCHSHTSLTSTAQYTQHVATPHQVQEPAAIHTQHTSGQDMVYINIMTGLKFLQENRRFRVHSKYIGNDQGARAEGHRN